VQLREHTTADLHIATAARILEQLWMLIGPKPATEEGLLPEG
jgi:hypothetical protein